MASIALMAIKTDESLGLPKKFTRAMFCSVVAEKNLMFFPARKTADA